MRRVIVESPYGSPDTRIVEANVIYARTALRDCLLSGEAPIASHLLYTQPGILIEPDRRTLGIEAGLAWRYVADLTAFYTDRGWSNGMLQALRRCLEEMRDLELRAISGPIRYPSWSSKELKHLIERSRL